MKTLVERLREAQDQETIDKLSEQMAMMGVSIQISMLPQWKQYGYSSMADMEVGVAHLTLESCEIKLPDGVSGSGSSEAVEK